MRQKLSWHFDMLAESLLRNEQCLHFAPGVMKSDLSSVKLVSCEGHTFKFWENYEIT